MKKITIERSKRSKAVALASVLLGVATVIGGVHHLSAQTRRADLDGIYVLRRSVAASEEAARNAAIQAATRSLDASVQKRWRAVIEISSVPEQRLRIATTGGEIAIAKGDRAAVTTTVSVATRTIGENHTVSQQLDGRSLVQTLSSSTLSGLSLATPFEQASRYRQGVDAQTLEVETTISGGALKTPIVFSTTYDRL